MCGIVGGISTKNVVPVILEGLARLEYRGYDSVGVAIVDSNNKLLRERATGRVKELAEICAKNQNFNGLFGIGHTRWATHGGVNVGNAHPHFSNETLAIVHNGIIENYARHRAELKNQGYVFDSETDTEVIAHLIHSLLKKNNNLFESVKTAVSMLKGAYAIAVVSTDSPNEIVCARFGCPLVLGVGQNGMFFASDISALLPVTDKVVYLEDGDVAKLELSTYTIYDKTNNLVKRELGTSKLSKYNTELGQYSHYMQKEIFEQPYAILETLQSLGDKFYPEKFGDLATEIFKKINKVQIIACGTSLNAGHIAKYWIEEFTDIECNIDIASEYRYRRVAVNPDCLIVNISQSGETADTLAAVKYAYELGMTNSLSICNVPESSLVRLSKLHILTEAGPEVGVASTKAFTTQLVVLLYLTFTLAKVRGLLSAEAETEVMQNLRKLPHLITATLSLEKNIKGMAREIASTKNALFLGRNALYPIAIEGALKLKEISYIHAESYATGELKHGPLALIDKDMPCVVLMPSGLLLDKMESNIQEILARNGIVYLFTDSDSEVVKSCHKAIQLDTKDVVTYLLPIVYVVPLQLLSYHVAIFKGTDVDKPRNLAKSVTVE